MKEKRPEQTTRKGIIFHQDNARPHTYLVTRKKYFNTTLLEMFGKLQKNFMYYHD